MFGRLKKKQLVEEPVAASSQDSVIQSQSLLFSPTPPYFADAQDTQESASAPAEVESEEEEAYVPPARNDIIPPPPPMFSSSDEEEEIPQRQPQRKSVAPRYSVGNIKMRLKSSTLSTRDLRKREKRKVKDKVKIEVLRAGEIKVHLFYSRTHRHPILKSMEEARDVLDWYTETRYIGVRPMHQQDNETFACYFIFNGSVVHLNRFVFASAELAAKKHDQLARENGIKYRINFPQRRTVALQTVKHKIKRASDYTYSARVGARRQFMSSNIQLMFGLIARLNSAHQSVQPEELWCALEQAIKLCNNWNTNYTVLREYTGRVVTCLAEVSRLLHLCWRVGDSLLLNEERNANKQRINWSRGIFQVVIDLRDQTTKRSGLPDIARALFSWAVDFTLTLEFDLLRNSNGEGDEEIEAFRLKLERYNAMKHWKHDAGFQYLLGAVCRCNGTEEQLKVAQRHFAEALELDQTHRASLLALAEVEVEIQRLHESMMYGSRGGILTLSQRSAQSSQQSNTHNGYNFSSDESNDDNASSSEEEDRFKRRRTLVGRQSLAPTAAASVDALELLQRLVKDNPRFPPALQAWDMLVFHDDMEENEETEQVVEEKRHSILRWIAVDGTLSGGAINKLQELWRLMRLTASRNDSSGGVAKLNLLLVQCFWCVVDCIERLTHRECPAYTHTFNPASTYMWELLVCVLNLLPQDTVQFDAKRKSLWQSRFFPQRALGALTDPFQFTPQPHCVQLRTKKQRELTLPKSDKDHYFHSLQAVAAHMLMISPEYHYEIVRRLGLAFVNEACVRQACRNMGMCDEEGQDVDDDDDL